MHTSEKAAFFEANEAFAREEDARDPLARQRERFSIPKRPNGEPVIYLCGNSLGLQPKAARRAVEEELDAWATLAVDAHFSGKHPWYPYHEALRDASARLVGAHPHEVVMMNGLTVNLHLMMASFYRPTTSRWRILMEASAFPSDTYAAQTQLGWHGLNPTTGLLRLGVRPGEFIHRIEDIEELLEREGDQVALVLLGAVNYFTGQAFDIPRIVAAAHRRGCIVGLDCAHAAGNLPLQLHADGVDFAAWCTYKYLNGGPGSVAGCFVHERHARNTALPRFGGWWGNDPSTRFRMHLNERFEPMPTADAWQLSNPPILSMAAVRASLEIFDEVGIEPLRRKSERLTGYLEFLLDRIPSQRYTVITPRDPAARGAQLSILVHERPRDLHRALESAHIVCDFREPNVIRVAPVPLYNTFHEVWRFSQILAAHR